MASCDKELSTLPVLVTCPTGVEYVLLIGVPSLINGDNLGGYGLIKWSTLFTCLGAGGGFIPIGFVVGQPLPAGVSLSGGNQIITIEDSVNSVSGILLFIQGQPIPLSSTTTADLNYTPVYNDDSADLLLSSPLGDLNVVMIFYFKKVNV